MAAEPRMQVVMFYAFKRPDRQAGELIGLLARSVRVHYPDCRLVLLTNPPAHGSGVPPGVELRVSEVHPDHVMVERLRMFLDHLRSVEPGTTVVFMDTDMLVVRRFDALLAADADVTVTVRRDPIWPINAGLIVARTEHHDRVCGIFERLLERCETLPDAEKRWYGDQVALAGVLAPTPGRFRRAYMQERHGCRVRFAPSYAFNHTPRPWMLRLGLFRPGACILHFKGARKTRMPGYARRYLSGPARCWLGLLARR